jgi:lipoprotein-releasing system ATP-binding protein
LPCSRARSWRCWALGLGQVDAAAGGRLLEGGFEGSIRINGRQAEALDTDGRTDLRREALGFVYQFHHLLPDFTAIENVTLPQLIRGTEPSRARNGRSRC